ncbi:MAG: KpsF/GutQ family sugar-phosphate isomerase [Neisseria sp.]|nr:KpsF/GutQ family sugar-phosphate isomerase [Neisseria sp.]
MNQLPNTDYFSVAQDVLRTEAQALHDLADSLDKAAFERAIAAMLACKGRVVVTGMGKSGHVAKKIAATLASTGTPAFFVHPAEAAHGDLGMILPDDVVLALSHSGESDEVLAILPALKRKGTVLIAISGRKQSTLAQQADIDLHTAVTLEACPLGLAPTTSTTVVMALGDALAVALLKARDFTPDDFALSHPAGSLGKRLLVRVSDLMHAGDALPVVAPDAPLPAAIVAMSEKGMGMVLIADDNRRLRGIFTDGDLRRLFQHGQNLQHLTIQEVMSENPFAIAADRLASEALHHMQQRRINGLAVTDEQGCLQGALNMHDLLQAGIV